MLSPLLYDVLLRERERELDELARAAYLRRLTRTRHRQRKSRDASRRRLVALLVR